MNTITPIAPATGGPTALPAPGPSRPSDEPIPPQITGPPYITLVDVEGNPVPDCERYTPTCPPDPEDPMDWDPSWDNFYWATEPELGLGDDAPAIGLDEPDDNGPAPADPIPFGRSGLWDLPAPICGGAPNAERYTPTDQDWLEYREWSAEIDRRASAARMAEAIYGYE